MIKVLLLEDEEHIRSFLKQLINEVSGISQVFDTPSGEEAIAWAKTYNPQLMILDIELADASTNGLEVARAIYQFNKELFFVFVTAHPQYAIDAFEIHPYSYVLKPVLVDKFKKLITEIVSKLQSQAKLNPEILNFKIKDQLIHINKKEIIFIEVQGHTTNIHTTGGIWEYRKSLDEVEVMLGEGFLRVHRAYIINPDKVKKTKLTLDRSYEIEFHDYPQVALMSRYYYSNYKKHFEM